METLVTEQMLPELEEVERPPGPGPGLLPPDEDMLQQPPYVHHPISPRLGHNNNFISLAPPPPPPPPVPMMDYQTDHSSNFTQTFLRGILTSIDSKDPVVANAWLETLLDAIDLLPIEVIKQEIIIIAINKSQLSQPPFSRIASCKILGKLSTKLDQQAVRQEILPSTLALCQDVEADVRNCMCRHLAFVARGVGLELTKSAILPVLVELSNDESADVRLSAIETVVHLLSLLDDEVCNNTIVPLVMKSCDQAKSLEDCTLPVIARHLGRLCHGLTPNLSQEQKSWFTDFYRNLSKIGSTNSTEVGSANTTPMPDLVPRSAEDKSAKYTQCREACAYNLPGMVLFVGASNFSEKLFSTFCDFATDSSPLVRKTLASSLHELIKIIGTNFCLLKMQIVALFNDSNIEVLSSMVFNMVYVIDGLARFGVLQFGSTSSYSQELSLAILHMEEMINNTRNWRLHSDCLEKLSCLANCISANVIQHRYIPLLFLRAHKSRPLPSRVAAVRTLLVILRFTVKQDDRSSIIQRIKAEFARGKSSHSRMLFLKMCEMAICLFSKLYFKQNFFSELLCLSQDSVANIRLKVVSMLPQLKSLLMMPADSAHLVHLEDTIKELLVVETDRDVLGSLQTSIHHLADIETALDNMTKLGLYSDDDMVDDRKLREERLIANMEEQIKQVQGAKFEQLIAPSAIPSRLRSLALDRKRSESLPPALSRTETSPKPRYSSPEPQRLVSSISPRVDCEPSKPPSYSQDIWHRDRDQFEEKEYKPKTSLAASAPFSSSLENLDTQEFLVDAGIKLPSAASMPNLTSVGKMKDQIIRSNSIPDNSNIDGELAKYLISNEEMEHYEAEYHKAAQEIKIDPNDLGEATAATVSKNVPNKEDANNQNNSKLRGRTETKMRAPSFTSALINRPGPSASATVGSVTINKSPVSFSKPIQSAEKQEVRLSPKPINNKSSNGSSRNSPPKSDDRVSTSQQRWNDGSIERLAEKWAAKRDALLKETGVMAENLQQRKAAMEQKLESVKKSIPKRSMGFTPQSAQKRLSLCESSIKGNKTDSMKKDLPKRKSLDADVVLTSPSEDSDEDSDKINDLPPPPPAPAPGPAPPPAHEQSGRKSSPEAGSSDSDDSLPPYPAMDKTNSDADKPLPPPPVSLEYSYPSPDKTTKIKPTSTTSLPAKSRVQLFNQAPTRSSMATFKTVTAPQTSVAVSRQLQAPKRSIADSPKLPLPNKSSQDSVGSSPAPVSRTAGLDAAKNLDDLKLSEVNKISSPDMKTTINAAVHPSQSKMNDKPGGAAASNQSSSKIKLFNVKKPSDDPQSQPQSPAGGNHQSSMLQINRQPVGPGQARTRASKLSTTHVQHQPATTSSSPASSQFSSFKGQDCPKDEPSSVAQKGGRTIVYIESSPATRLKPPSSSIPKERTLAMSGSTPKEVNVTSRMSNLKVGRYGSRISENAGMGQTNNNLRTFQSKFTDDKKNKTGNDVSSKNSTPSGSSENILADNSSNTTSAPAGKLTKSGILGPRRSSGLRMWQGPVRQMSRSPSPGQVTSRDLEAKASDTATLPRNSTNSRLRTLTTPTQSYGSQQRRSYGGVTSSPASSGLVVPKATAGKHRSAPSTPRHSQADLRPDNSPSGSRSASPVILRHKQTQSHDNLKPPSSVSRLSAGNTMLKRPSAPSSHDNDRGVSLTPSSSRPSSYNSRPSGSISQLSRPSTSGPRLLVTPGTNSSSQSVQQSPKSRLPNPPKSFGFSY